MNGTDSAFTLVELLVVISIIALLISILLPALSKARWQAKVVSCGSQERQIHIGLMAYATDAQGHYMAATGATNIGLEIIKLGAANGGPAYDMRDPLSLYIVSPETFYCPDGSAEAHETYNSVWGSWYSDRGQLWITYAILGGAGNPALAMGLSLDRAQTRLLGDTPWFADGIRWVNEENHVVQPSRAPFLADLMRSSYTQQITDPGVWRHNHSGYLGTTQAGGPSEGFFGGNTTYFDGHTKWKNQTSMGKTSGPDNDDDVIFLGDQSFAF